MTDLVVMGVFTLAGGVLGFMGHYLSAKVGFDKSQTREIIKRLAGQVEAYHKLEELYKIEVASNTDQSPKTVLETMRKKVEKDDRLERPCMTGRQARDILEKYRCGKL